MKVLKLHLLTFLPLVKSRRFMHVKRNQADWNFQGNFRNLATSYTAANGTCRNSGEMLLMKLAFQGRWSFGEAESSRRSCFARFLLEITLSQRVTVNVTVSHPPTP